MLLGGRVPGKKPPGMAELLILEHVLAPDHELSPCFSTSSETHGPTRPDSDAQVLPGVLVPVPLAHQVGLGGGAVHLGTRRWSRGPRGEPGARRKAKNGRTGKK